MIDSKNGGRAKGVVLVTGGSRGIGRATCLKLASMGFTVGVNYVNREEAATEVVDAISSSGGDARALAGDISQEFDVMSLFDVAREMGPLVGLVNNAGILETQLPLLDMTLDRFERVFATNVHGTFLCCREAIRTMSRSRGGQGGAIVNISSIAARLGSPNEYIDYAASKGAIDTMTIGLAKEVGHEGIRVNAVRPGVIETEMHASGGEPGRAKRVGAGIPLGRAGRAEEIANVAAWLVSDEASYCNGALIDAGGGR